MKIVDFDYSGALGFVREHEITDIERDIVTAHKMLREKTGAGADFTGWVDLPAKYDREEFGRIIDTSDKIRSDSDALVVIGIGGSYLGARAVIEALSHSFHNCLPDSKRETPQIFFAGNNVSSTYLAELLELLEDREVSVNVVSKSGTTTEPAIAFRIFREFMEKKYGKKGAAGRIYATTDKARGSLKKIALEEKYESFFIPDNVGGRYSVLTAVGLLPIAAGGVDINKLMNGAYDAYELYDNSILKANDCYLYAAVRNVLYRKNRTIEILVNYDPSLHYFTEWWKQLYGESEGKDGQGIFPAGVDFTADLHSMGQYVQEGPRSMFETVINVTGPRKDITINKTIDNADGFDFIAGKTVDFVNKKAMEGTYLAHTDGGVPNLTAGIPELNAYYLGGLIYFFEKACGISGYLLGVNPFNQPGVEAYKKNMFALLGKPGFEAERETLLKRLRK